MACVSESVAAENVYRDANGDVTRFYRAQKAVLAIFK
jgi:hypothetical protein